jgi:ABC-type transport system involved in cytochrome c biogenesis permease component
MQGHWLSGVGIVSVAKNPSVLLTGYLGGAVASNLRLGNPLFRLTLFPIYVGVLIWGSLLLR